MVIDDELIAGEPLVTKAGNRQPPTAHYSNQLVFVLKREFQQRIAAA